MAPAGRGVKEIQKAYITYMAQFLPAGSRKAAVNLFTDALITPGKEDRYQIEAQDILRLMVEANVWTEVVDVMVKNDDAGVLLFIKALINQAGLKDDQIALAAKNNKLSEKTREFLKTIGPA